MAKEKNLKHDCLSKNRVLKLESQKVIVFYVLYRLSIILLTFLLRMSFKIFQNFSQGLLDFLQFVIQTFCWSLSPFKQPFLKFPKGFVKFITNTRFKVLSSFLYLVKRFPLCSFDRRGSKVKS